MKGAVATSRDFVDVSAGVHKRLGFGSNERGIWKSKPKPATELAKHIWRDTRSTLDYGNCFEPSAV